MSKTLVAAGRLKNKSEQRGESIIVRVHLTGDDAKRFEEQRGQQCPKDFAMELVTVGLAKIERSNPVKGFLR